MKSNNLLKNIALYCEFRILWAEALQKQKCAAFQFYPDFY
jgi:hypothetical protein